MLGRIATNVSVRQWTLAATGLGLVIAIAIATAPKPSCKCPSRAAATERVAWSEARNPCEAKPAFHARSTTMVIEQEIACAERMVMSPRRAYLALMRARSLDTNHAYAPTIDLMLFHLAPLAANQFLEIEDYENATAAMLVAVGAQQTLSGDAGY
jgi:hypothetical protein